MIRAYSKAISHFKPRFFIPSIQRLLSVAAPWIGILLLVVGIWIGSGTQNTAFGQTVSQSGQNAGDGTTVPMTDIHDIKSALAMGIDLRLLIWSAVALLVLAVLAVAIWWLRKRRKQVSTKPAATPLPPPEVEAYGLLDGLAAEDHGDLKRFYYRLSAILRRYVERRFGFPAAEMTTEELLPAVGRLEIPPDLNEQIKAFCLRSDPIKFADAVGDHSRVAHELAFVRDLVRLTTIEPVEEKSDLNVETKASEMSTIVTDTKKIEYQGTKQGSSSD